MSNALVHLARQAAGIGPLHITKKQKYAALAFAGAVDLLQATALFPSTTAGVVSPVEWGVDIGTAVVLTLILGWNWRLLVAFLLELLPMVGLFPTWSAMMLTVTAMSTEKKENPAIGVAPAGGSQVGVHPLPGSTGLPVPPAAGPAGEPARFPGVYQKRSRLESFPTVSGGLAAGSRGERRASRRAPGGWRPARPSGRRRARRGGAGRARRSSRRRGRRQRRRACRRGGRRRRRGGRRG